MIRYSIIIIYLLYFWEMIRYLGPFKFHNYNLMRALQKSQNVYIKTVQNFDNT